MVVPQTLDLTESRRLTQRARKVIPSGVTSQYRDADEINISSASGATITTVDGQVLTDWTMGTGTAIGGHAHPEINAAVTRGLELGSVTGIGVREEEVELAELVISLIPSVEKCLFFGSGTEGGLYAVRAMRAATGRKKIVKFVGPYHGHADQFMVGLRGGGDLSAGIPEEYVQHTLVCPYNDLPALADLLEQHRGEIAGAILEPFCFNAGGAIVPEREYLSQVISLVHDHGGLVCFDEVLTALGHGALSVQTMLDLEADLTILGKGVSDGTVPFTILGGRDEFMAHFDLHRGGKARNLGTYAGYLGGVYGALATIRLMERDDNHTRLLALGDGLRSGLTSAIVGTGLTGCVTGAGRIAVEHYGTTSVTSMADLERNDLGLWVAVRSLLPEYGHYVKPSPDGARIHVSIAHSATDVADLVEAYALALDRAVELVRA